MSDERPFGPEHNRRTRERLAEQGVEMTPDELTETRKQAFASIRAKLREAGFNPPESDEELLLLMMEAASP